MPTVAFMVHVGSDGTFPIRPDLFLTTATHLLLSLQKVNLVKLQIVRNSLSWPKLSLGLTNTNVCHRS